MNDDLNLFAKLLKSSAKFEKDENRKKCRLDAAEKIEKEQKA